VDRGADVGSEPVLVSACLLGVGCNHAGGHSRSEAVLALGERVRLVPVCPEAAGGLPTPRPAAELGADGRVVTAAGEDVTDHYLRGARHAVEVARAAGIRRAILKARSPSCGSGQVYDGTHRRVLVAGDGVAAAALKKAGVEVLTDEELGKGAISADPRPGDPCGSAGSENARSPSGRLGRGASNE
jgi:uncharacterized protein YbbK (DUF523 family)